MKIDSESKTRQILLKTCNFLAGFYKKPYLGDVPL